MVSLESKIIFLMPPKTASHSLRFALRQSDLKFERLHNLNNPNNFPSFHLFLSEIVERAQIKNLEEFKIFQIYRDPLEKFVSAYYNFLEIIPKDWKVQSMSLNEFVNYFNHCFESKDYIECMYDQPNFIEDCIKNRYHFGGTRYFTEQYKWNDLNQKINYLNINKINHLSEILGVEIQIPHHNHSRHSKDNLDDKSIITLTKIYEKDFLLVKNPS